MEFCFSLLSCVSDFDFRDRRSLNPEAVFDKLLSALLLENQYPTPKAANIIKMSCMMFLLYEIVVDQFYVIQN